MDDATYRNLLQAAHDLILKPPVVPALVAPAETPMLVRCLDDELVKLQSKEQLLLPNFREYTDTIAVFSDYGGEHQGSAYFTYSFLFASWDVRRLALESMREVRKAHGLMDPYREFQFKDLRYGPIDRALPAWLEAANQVHGLLFTMVVDKTVSSAFAINKRDEPQKIARMLEEEGFGSWKADVAEKAMRVLHAIAYWSSLLGRVGHNLFWMTDNDAIICNDDRTADLRRLFSAILKKYARVSYGKLGFAAPFTEDGSMKPYDVVDLLSLPDLASGAIEAFFTNCMPEGQATLKDNVCRITNWMGQQAVGLKKLVFVVRPGVDGALETGFCRITPERFDERALFLPVSL